MANSSNGLRGVHFEVTNCKRFGQFNHQKQKHNAMSYLKKGVSEGRVTPKCLCIGITFEFFSSLSPAHWSAERNVKEIQ